MKNLFEKLFRVGIVVIILVTIICVYKIIPRYYNQYSKSNVKDTVSLVVGEKNETDRLVNNLIIDGDKILFSYEDMNRFIDAYIVKDEKYNQIITNSKFHTKIIDYTNSRMREYLSDTWENIYVKEDNSTIYFDLKQLEDVYGIDVKYVPETNIVKIEKDIHTYSVGTISKKAKLMSLPSKISAKIGILNENDTVFVLREDKDYYKVIDSMGRFGYIKQSAIPDENIKEVCNYTEPKYDNKINLSWDYMYLESPDRSDERKIEGVNILSPTWIDLLDENGSIQNKVDTDYISWARSNDYDIWVMFTNNSKIESTRNIMRDSKIREELIKKVLNICVENKFDGINIDFENMYKEDADLFSQFVREMTVAFNQKNMIVSVDVTVPDGSDTWSLCFDRATLGDSANYVVLMAYDQTPGGSNVPGSVAAGNWVKTNIEKLLKEVDADKLILGIPFYTRIWKTSGSSVTSYTIDMSDISNYLVKNGLTKTWLEDEKQNYVKYSIGSTTYEMWIEDLQSIEEKLKLYKEYNLAGVASWEKDREDANVWSLINSYLYK